MTERAERHDDDRREAETCQVCGKAIEAAEKPVFDDSGKCQECGQPAQQS